MIRKQLSMFIIILAVSLLVVQPVQAAKSYYAEYFDVQIDLQEGGSAIVTETVKFHFEGDPFTFAFREISATETDGITFFDASMDGVVMQRGTDAGQVEVEAGNPLKVTWHFAPTSDAAHVFTVRYLAEGVIRKGDADTLIWRAIPEESGEVKGSERKLMHAVQQVGRFYHAARCAEGMPPPTMARIQRFERDEVHDGSICILPRAYRWKIYRSEAKRSVRIL